MVHFQRTLKQNKGKSSGTQYKTWFVRTKKCLQIHPLNSRQNQHVRVDHFLKQIYPNN